MNSVTMSMDGVPEISGTTWYSKTSGDHFTVKDMMMDGESFFFTTTDGRTISSDAMSNYIQSDKPVHNIPKVNPGGKIKLGDLKKEDNSIRFDNELLPEDLEALGNLSDPLSTPISNKQSYKKPEVNQNPNQIIIDKAFSKIDAPEIRLNLIWDHYPEKELDMLMTVMDIPKEDIAEFIYNKWFNDNSQLIKDKIKKILG